MKTKIRHDGMTFSQQWLWAGPSSGKWHSVFRHVPANHRNLQPPSSGCMEASGSCKISTHIYQSTLCHIPDNICFIFKNNFYYYIIKPMHLPDASQSVYSTNVHSTWTTDALSTRTSKCECWIHFIFYFNKCIQYHGTTSEIAPTHIIGNKH